MESGWHSRGWSHEEAAVVRTFVLGAGALALGFIAVVGSGGETASAAVVPVAFTGPIHCAATGSLSFNAKLNNSPAASSTVTLRVALAGCTGTGTTSGGVTLSGGKLKATSTSTLANSCGYVLGGNALPAMTGTITWKTTNGKAVASTVTVSGATNYYDAGANVISTYLPTTISGGSFVAQPTTYAGLTSNMSGYKLSSACDAAGLGLLKFGNPGTVTGSMTVGA